MAQPTTLDQMLAFCAVVHDPRRQHPTTLHTLETILTVTMLATMCGAQHWVESEHWGKAKAAWPSVRIRPWLGGRIAARLATAPGPVFISPTDTSQDPAAFVQRVRRANDRIARLRRSVSGTQ